MRTYLGFILPRLDDRAPGSTNAVAFGALAIHLAGAADCGSLFASPLFRGLFIVTTKLHLTVDALALKLLLERAQRLIDIIVANHDLHKVVTLRSISPEGTDNPPSGKWQKQRDRREYPAPF
jgi:hypothetical protein